MKVLVQNVKSGQYLAQHGTWTDVVAHAKDFRSSCYAYAVLKMEKVPGVRVLFYFEELEYSINARRGYGERLCQHAYAGQPEF